MKTVSTFIILLSILTACNQNVEKNMANKNSAKQVKLEPKVTGIGGIFFRSKDPKATREWYNKNLGLVNSEYGSPFEFRNSNNPEEINYLIWNPFPDTTDYFNPSEKEFMINYRVQNIEDFVEKLRRNGVQIIDSIETYDYGKFVHIMDADGNKIELWEPIDSVLTGFGGETVK